MYRRSIHMAVELESQSKMGNQREIRQVFPTYQLGVDISIRKPSIGAISGILGQQKRGYFYTYISDSTSCTSFPNMDGEDLKLVASIAPRFIIQSGGKMWCGYDAFCDHITTTAPHLHDAVFLVGDEEDYIDEFRIADGELQRERVHAGSWRPLDQFVRTRFPKLVPM